MNLMTSEAGAMGFARAQPVLRSADTSVETFDTTTIDAETAPCEQFIIVTISLGYHLTKAKRMQLWTSRLILRSWKDSDRRPFAEMSGDVGVMEYLRPLATRGASDAWVDFQINHESSHGFCLWAVESRETGMFMGAVGLLRVGFVARFTPAVEIGWRLGTQFWGQGFAVEAARESLRFGFEQIHLNEIVAYASIRNMRSRRVMTKLGMSHDSADDFEHPRLVEGDPLRRQVLHRVTRDAWESQFP